MRLQLVELSVLIALLHAVSARAGRRVLGEGPTHPRRAGSRYALYPRFRNAISRNHYQDRKLLGDFNCDQVAFYRTHKTGSTTLGSIFYRLAVLRRKKFYYQTGTRHQVDVNFSAPRADWFISHTPHVLPQFQELYDALASSPGKITILRDPVDRYISHFNFFERLNARGAKLGESGGFNRQAYEMGVHESEGVPGLEKLKKSRLWRDTVFVLLEHLDEGLAALHVHCGWPLKDLAYTATLCASCGNLIRTDGILIPKPEPVTEEQRVELREKNYLDQMLVDAASEKWEDVRRRGGAALYVATLELKRQQKLIAEYCKSRVKHVTDYASYPGCFWLAMSDLEYERTVSPDGIVYGETSVKPAMEHRGLPLITVQQMMDDYDRMYEQLMGTFAMPGSVIMGGTNSNLQSMALPADALGMPQE